MLTPHLFRHTLVLQTFPSWIKTRRRCFRRPRKTHGLDTRFPSLSCSGAPLGAACQLPSTLQISNGNAAPFMVTVITSGKSVGIFPFSNMPRSTPFPLLRTVPGLAAGSLLLLLLAFGAKRYSNAHARRLVFAGAFAAIMFLEMLGVMSAVAGGGSSAITSPPQIVTPQGQSTITVTPSAASAGGKPLQLQLIQLTLTVN